MQNEIQQSSKQPTIENALTFFVLAPILMGILLAIAENIFGVNYYNRVINGLLLIPILLIVIKKQNLCVANVLNIKKINYRVVILSILIGIAGCFINIYLYDLMHILLNPVRVFANLYPEPKGKLDSYFFVFSLVICAPLCEEFFYRGYLLNAFKKFGFIQAIVFTSFLFGIVHMDNITHIISSGFLGLVFGYLVYRTGSTFSSILAHGVCNAVILSLAYFHSGKFNTYIDGYIGAILVISAIILMIISIKMLIKETSFIEADKVRFKGFWDNAKSLFELWQGRLIIFGFLFYILFNFFISRYIYK